MIRRYVSTRHYRAPEIILSENTYNECVDIWSAGCIFAEMLLGKPLLPSTNYINHFMMILELLGSPTDEYIEYICAKGTTSIIKNLPKKEKKDFSTIFIGCTPDELEVLEKTLTLDVRLRANATEILGLNYFSELHDASDEPVSKAKFDWTFTGTDYTLQDLKDLIYKEVCDFNKDA